MIEKVKLNEVAKDLNISGKDLTALLQQRFGGEAKSRRRCSPARSSIL
ncbi:MAG: hypothetical protein ACLTY5_04855 [Angelakisella sp.]